MHRNLQYSEIISIRYSSLLYSRHIYFQSKVIFRNLKLSNQNSLVSVYV